ncbi:MAG: hypothetical protein AB1733_21010 [Thermodesulfobacteriota bacterium]
MINICRPDSTKSCAACCGLYNVNEATRPILESRLRHRTTVFSTVDRTPNAIEGFAELIRRSESISPLDEDIHVCEFTGFVDPQARIVGCLLHPATSGNDGLDLRGLCHYGSLACKSFFCPAWTELPPRLRELVIALVEDWYLYGLLITDVDYVVSLFALIEYRVGSEIGSPAVLPPAARESLLTMLEWKDRSPLGQDSAVRRNRYYMKRTVFPDESGPRQWIATLTKVLEFTFDVQHEGRDAAVLIEDHLDSFASAYKAAL